MNLYLSRLFLNPLSRQVNSELVQPYEMHRTLMRAFPEASAESKHKARDEFGVLFRSEVDELQRVVKIYVQSRIEPDWSFLEELNGYLQSGMKMPEYGYKNIMPALGKLKSGQLLSFRLCANPTKRIAKRDDPMKGKRVELSREDEQIVWLIRKGQKRAGGITGGFEFPMKEFTDVNGEERLIPRIKVRREGKQKGRKKIDKRGHAMTHLSVLFEGVLQVTDKNAFLETITRGIGSGKAFGYGLLSIAAAPDLGVARKK